MNEAKAITRAPSRGLRDTGGGSRLPRVIAVNRFYWPDFSATGQLLNDVTTHLARVGWPNVTVITSRTCYEDQATRFASKAEHGGVTIRRVWSSRLSRYGLVGRMVDYLTFHVFAFAALLFEARRDDAILVTTDPPLFVVLADLAARLTHARLLTWNHDLFPEVAEAVGFTWLGGRVGAVLRRLRNRALRAAVENIAISATMAKRMRAELGETARISLIPNWCDARIRPVARAENRLRAQWGLGDAFVIGYSGNLGRVHIPGKVAELVRGTLDIPGVQWLFIGGGSGLARVRAVVAETGARNVHFLPYQERSDLAESLSAVDLHLVSLDPACEELVFPSKIYGIRAAGRPTLFLGAPGGKIAAELTRRKTGATLDESQPDCWREVVLSLRSDRDGLDAMGKRARALHEVLARAPGEATWASTLTWSVRSSPGTVVHSAG